MSHEPLIDIAVQAQRLGIPVVFLGRDPDEWLNILAENVRLRKALREPRSYVSTVARTFPNTAKHRQLENRIDALLSSRGSA
jgi:hypothetical protein